MTQQYYEDAVSALAWSVAMAYFTSGCGWLLLPAVLFGGLALYPLLGRLWLLWLGGRGEGEEFGCCECCDPRPPVCGCPLCVNDRLELQREARRQEGGGVG